MKKKTKLIQLDNHTTVVTTFHGVPCAIEIYSNDKEALKAYEYAKDIHAEVAKQTLGRKAEIRESFTEKSRVKTSCSGLPRCVFEDHVGFAVVRGPVLALPRSVLSYVATLQDGSLEVTGYTDPCQAQKVYKEIRDAHADNASFQESDLGFTKNFSTDDHFGAEVGIMDIVHEESK